jgi:transposase
MVCAGIDTGKRKLDATLHRRRERLEVENSPEGHNRLSAWLREHGVKRVGIEASGGYEIDIVAKLRRENKTQVRNGHGRRCASSSKIRFR